MGMVHEAVDRRTGQTVALKSLKTPLPDEIRRLKREFRVLSGLVHPNLVHLHELFEDEHGCFITMQLVDGVDALEWVESAPDRIEAALDLGRQLASTLLFLHERNRLHLDIKPGNMVVEPSGRLVLLDFGISRALAGMLVEGTEPVHWGGTPAYCAPEQLETGSIDARADWYGFAATLYELVSGRLPYDGNAPQVMQSKQQRRPAVPVLHRAPFLTPAVARAIDGLLHPEPEGRPALDEVIDALELEPEAETAVLSAPAPQFELVGRERELRRLDDCAERARDTGRAEMELRGTSGIGKTALVRAFLSAQKRSRAGAVVLAGTSYEREWIPFNAFDSLVTNLVDAIRVFPPSVRLRMVPTHPGMLARLFPAFRRVPEIDEAAGPSEQPTSNSLPLRRDGFDAFAEVLEGYADGRLAVLALDDIQWADRDSLALLDYLRQAELSCSLFVLASRRLGPGDDVARLRAPGEVLNLGPLDDEAARELAIASLGQSSDEELIDEVLAEADGMPLWIEQLGLRWASTRERPSLEGLIERAVGSLTSDGRAVLDALTVAGRPLSSSQLEGFMGGKHSLRVLDQLGVFGLTVPVSERTDASYDVRHARVRDVVSARLTAERRAELALMLAEQYIVRGGDDEEVARHLLAAGDTERGATFAIRAAHEAAKALAFGRSARLLEAAIEHTAPPARGELLEQLADVLSNDARAEASAKAYLAAALDAEDPARRLQLRHLGAEQMMRSGRVDEGRELLEGLLAESGLSLPGGEVQATLQLVWNRARLKLRGMDFDLVDEADLDRTQLTRIDAAWSAAATLALVDAVTAAAFQARGLLMALELGEPERIGRSLGAEAVFRAAFGDHESARVLWERNREVVRARPTAMGRAGLSTSECLSAYQRGDWALSHRAAGEAMEHLSGERVNLSWIRSTAVIYRLAAAGHLGLLEEVGTDLPRELEHARARGDLHAVLHLTLGMPIPVAAILDRAEEGAREAEETWARSPGRDYAQLQIHYLRTRVELALYRGAFDEAREASLESWELVSGSNASRLPVLKNWASELALRGMLGASDGPPKGRDRKLILRLLKQLGSASELWARSCGALAHGQLHTLDGHGTEAAAKLSQALSGFEQSQMKLYAEATRRRLLAHSGEEVPATRTSDALWSRWVRWGMKPDKLIQMVAPVGPTPSGPKGGRSDAQRTGAVQPTE